jgi:hypothetical protein
MNFDAASELNAIEQLRMMSARAKLKQATVNRSSKPLQPITLAVTGDVGEIAPLTSEFLNIDSIIVVVGPIASGNTNAAASGSQTVRCSRDHINKFISLGMSINPNAMGYIFGNNVTCWISSEQMYAFGIWLGAVEYHSQVVKRFDIRTNDSFSYFLYSVTRNRFPMALSYADALGMSSENCQIEGRLPPHVVADMKDRIRMARTLTYTTEGTNRNTDSEIWWTKLALASNVHHQIKAAKLNIGAIEANNLMSSVPNDALITLCITYGNKNRKGPAVSCVFRQMPGSLEPKQMHFSEIAREMIKEDNSIRRSTVQTLQGSVSDFNLCNFQVDKFWDFLSENTLGYIVYHYLRITATKMVGKTTNLDILAPNNRSSAFSKSILATMEHLLLSGGNVCVFALNLEPLILTSSYIDPKTRPKPISVLSWINELCLSTRKQNGSPFYRPDQIAALVTKSSRNLLKAIALRSESHSDMPISAFLTLNLASSALSNEKTLSGQVPTVSAVSFTGTGRFSCILMNPLSGPLRSADDSVMLHRNIGIKDFISPLNAGKASQFLNDNFKVMVKSVKNADLNDTAALTSMLSDLVNGFLKIGSLSEEVYDELDDDLSEVSTVYLEPEDDSENDVTSDFSDFEDDEGIDNMSSEQSTLCSVLMEAQLQEYGMIIGFEDKPETMFNYVPSQMMTTYEKGCAIEFTNSTDETNSAKAKTSIYKSTFVVFSKTFVAGSARENKSKTILFVADSFEKIETSNHNIEGTSFMRPAVGYPFVSVEVDSKDVSFPTETVIRVNHLALKNFRPQLFMSIGNAVNWVVDLNNFDAASSFARFMLSRHHNGSYRKNMSSIAVTSPDWFYYPCLRSCAQFALSGHAPMAIVNKIFEGCSAVLHRPKVFSMNFDGTGYETNFQMNSGEAIELVKVSRKFAIVLNACFCEAIEAENFKLIENLRSKESFGKVSKVSYVSSTRSVQSKTESLLHILTKSAFPMAEIKIKGAMFDACIEIDGQYNFFEIKTSMSSILPKVGINSPNQEQFNRQNRALTTLRFNTRLSHISICREVGSTCYKVYVEAEGKSISEIDPSIDSANFVLTPTAADINVGYSNVVSHNFQDLSLIPDVTKQPSQFDCLIHRLIMLRLQKFHNDPSNTISVLSLGADPIDVDEISIHLANVLETGVATTPTETTLINSYMSIVDFDSESEITRAVNMRQPKALIESFDHYCEHKTTLPSFNEITPILLHAKTLSQWINIVAAAAETSNSMIAKIINLYSTVLIHTIQNEQQFIDPIAFLSDLLNDGNYPLGPIVTEIDQGSFVKTVLLSYLITSGSVKLTDNLIVLNANCAIATFGASSDVPTSLSASASKFETARMINNPKSFGSRQKTVIAAATKVYAPPAEYETNAFRLSELFTTCLNPVEAHGFSAVSTFCLQLGLAVEAFEIMSGQMTDRSDFPASQSIRKTLQMMLTGLIPHVTFWYTEQFLDFVKSISKDEHQSTIRKMSSLHFLISTTPIHHCFDKRVLFPFLQALNFTVDEITNVFLFSTSLQMISAQLFFRWLFQSLSMSSEILTLILRGTNSQSSNLKAFYKFSIEIGAVATKFFPTLVTAFSPPAIDVRTVDEVEQADDDSIDIRDLVKAAVRNYNFKANVAMDDVSFEKRVSEIMSPMSQADANILKSIKTTALNNAPGQTRSKHVRNMISDLKVLISAQTVTDLDGRTLLKITTPMNLLAAASEKYRDGQNSLSKLSCLSHWSLPDTFNLMMLGASMPRTFHTKPSFMTHCFFSNSNSNPIRNIEDIVAHLTTITDKTEFDVTAKSIAKRIDLDFHTLLFYIARHISLQIIVGYGWVDALNATSDEIRDREAFCDRVLTTNCKSILQLDSDQIKDPQTMTIIRSVIENYLTLRFGSSILLAKTPSNPGGANIWQSKCDGRSIAVSYRADSEEMWYFHATAVTKIGDETVSAFEGCQKGFGPDVKPSWTSVSVANVKEWIMSSLTKAFHRCIVDETKEIHKLLLSPIQIMDPPTIKAQKTALFRVESAMSSVFTKTANHTAFACVYALSLLSRQSAVVMEVLYLAMKMVTSSVSMLHEELNEVLSDPTLMIGTRQLLRLFVIHFILVNYSTDITTARSIEAGFLSCDTSFIVRYIGAPDGSQTRDILSICQALQATGVSEAPGNVQVTQGTAKGIKELSAVISRDTVKMRIFDQMYNIDLSAKEIIEMVIPLEIAASFFFKHAPSVAGRRILLNRLKPSNSDLNATALSSLLFMMIKEPPSASRNTGIFAGSTQKTGVGAFAFLESVSGANSSALDYSEWLNSLTPKTINDRVATAVREMMTEIGSSHNSAVDLYCKVCRSIQIPEEFIAPGSVKATTATYFNTFLNLCYYFRDEATRFFGANVVSELLDANVFKPSPLFEQDETKQLANLDGFEAMRSFIFSTAYITAKRQKLGGRTITTQDVLTGLFSRQDQHIVKLGQTFKGWLPQTDMTTNSFEVVRDKMGQAISLVAIGNVDEAGYLLNPVYSSDTILQPNYPITFDSQGNIKLYSRFSQLSVQEMSELPLIHSHQTSLTLAEFIMAKSNGESPFTNRIIAHIADSAKFSPSDLNTGPNVFGPMFSAMNTAFQSRTTVHSLKEALQRRNMNSAMTGTWTHTQSNKGWGIAGESLASWNQGLQTTAASQIHTSSVTACNGFNVNFKSITGQSSDDKLGCYVFTEKAQNSRNQFFNEANDLLAELLDLLEDLKNGVKTNPLRWLETLLEPKQDLITYLCDISDIGGFTDSSKKSALGGCVLEVVFKIMQIKPTIKAGESCIEPIPSMGYSLASGGSSINASSACTLHTSATAWALSIMNTAKDTIDVITNPSKASISLCNDWSVGLQFSKLFKPLRKPGAFLFLNPMIGFSIPCPLFGLNTEMSSLWASIGLTTALAALLTEEERDEIYIEVDRVIKETYLTAFWSIIGERQTELITESKMLMLATTNCFNELSNTKTLLGELMTPFYEEKATSIVSTITKVAEIDPSIGNPIFHSFKLACIANMMNATFALLPITTAEMADKHIGNLMTREVVMLMRKVYTNRIGSTIPPALPASNAVDGKYIASTPKQMSMQHKKNTEVMRTINEMLPDDDDVPRKCHSYVRSLNGLIPIITRISSSQTQNFGINDLSSKSAMRSLEIKDALTNGTLSSQFTTAFNELMKGGLMIGRNMMGLKIANLTQNISGTFASIAWLWGNMSLRLSEIEVSPYILIKGVKTVKMETINANIDIPFGVMSRSAVGLIPHADGAMIVPYKSLELTNSQTICTLNCDVFDENGFECSRLSTTADYLVNWIPYCNFGSASPINSKSANYKIDGNYKNSSDSIKALLQNGDVLNCIPSVNDGISSIFSHIKITDNGINSLFTTLILPGMLSSMKLEPKSERDNILNCVETSASVNQINCSHYDIAIRAVAVVLSTNDSDDRSLFSIYSEAITSIAHESCGILESRYIDIANPLNSKLLIWALCFEDLPTIQNYKISLANIEARNGEISRRLRNSFGQEYNRDVRIQVLVRYLMLAFENVDTGLNIIRYLCDDSSGINTADYISDIAMFTARPVTDAMIIKSFSAVHESRSFDNKKTPIISMTYSMTKEEIEAKQIQFQLPVSRQPFSTISTASIRASAAASLEEISKIKLDETAYNFDNELIMTVNNKLVNASNIYPTTGSDIAINVVSLNGVQRPRPLSAPKMEQLTLEFANQFLTLAASDQIDATIMPLYSRAIVKMIESIAFGSMIVEELKPSLLTSLNELLDVAGNLNTFKDFMFAYANSDPAFGADASMVHLTRNFQLAMNNIQ